MKKGNYDFIKIVPDASGRTGISGETSLLTNVLFTIAYGDKVTVYILLKKRYHTMKYDKNTAGTGVRLKYPHQVKIHTDSCLRCRSRILSYDSSIYIMPVL